MTFPKVPFPSVLAVGQGRGRTEDVVVADGDLARLVFVRLRSLRVLLVFARVRALEVLFYVTGHDHYVL